MSCLLALAGVAQAGPSANHKILRLSTSPMAGSSASPSYRNLATMSSVSGAIGACPGGTVSTLGFWSILGHSEVPLMLRAARNPGNSTTIVLGWSGQADEFRVYRSRSPEGLLAPQNEIGATSSCELADSWNQSTLYFYRVAPASSTP